MVKLAATLPKEYDDNGLESNTRHLLSRYTSQEYTPAVVLLHTKDVHHTEDFEKVPRVAIVHIEPAIDPDDAETVRDLIVRLHDTRVAHIKQPLDLPDPDLPAEPAAPLELESSTGTYSIEVVDEPNAKFAVQLIAPSGATVLERHALPRNDYGEILPGPHPLHLLEAELNELVRQLIAEYEQGYTVTTADEDDVVDAELIDDTTTTTEEN